MASCSIRGLGRGYGNQLQRHLNQQLGIGTRNQRRRRHPEIQPIKFALAEDVSERFAAQAPLEQRRVMRLLFSAEDLFGMGEQVSTVHLQHRLEQALRLDARAAGIQLERGFQRCFILGQEGLDGVRHELMWTGCCSKKSNLAPLIRPIYPSATRAANSSRSSWCSR